MPGVHALGLNHGLHTLKASTLPTQLHPQPQLQFSKSSRRHKRHEWNLRETRGPTGSELKVEVDRSDPWFTPLHVEINNSKLS